MDESIVVVSGFLADSVTIQEVWIKYGRTQDTNRRFGLADEIWVNGRIAEAATNIRTVDPQARAIHIGIQPSTTSGEGFKVIHQVFGRSTLRTGAYATFESMLREIAMALNETQLNNALLSRTQVCFHGILFGN